MTLEVARSTSEADVEFAGDVAAVLDEDAGDDLPFGAGLVGAQGHAEHVAGDVAHFVGGAGELDAAPFAAAAGVDLGLDHPGSVAEPFGPLPGAGAVVADVPVRDRARRICAESLLPGTRGCSLSSSLVGDCYLSFDHSGQITPFA